MNSTPLVVTLLLVLTAVPSVQAEYLTRSFLEGGVGFNFEDGAGLYNPNLAPAPEAYCFALRSFFASLVPVSYYYTSPNRYWPNAAAGVLLDELDFPDVDDPTACATLLTGSTVFVDDIQVDAGLAFTVSDRLGPTEVADLSATTMALEYCDVPSNPTTVQGTPNLQVLPTPPTVLEAWSAKDVGCNGIDSYQLYPGCSSFALTTAPGEVVGTGPVFLGENGCNSLKGSLAQSGDFTVERQVDGVTFDTALGTTNHADRDCDFFVVGNVLGGNPGALLAWSLLGTANATPFVQLFQNVDNLKQNIAC